MSKSVAVLLAESLEAHGVDRIFCVPGESYVGLTSILVERGSPEVIVCRHESGAGFMALADSELTGRARVAIVFGGPGLSNDMVALHSAFHDATPLVMLVGHVERRDVGRGALQEQNYARLLSDVTKLVIEVIDPDQASEAIARAFHTAHRATPGPVAVILPEDIFDRQTDAPVDAPRDRLVAAPRESDLARIAEMLSAAERPPVLVGGGLQWEAAQNGTVLHELATFARQWNLPIIPTHRRPQLFDARDGHYGGYMGIRVPRPQLDTMKRTDLIVALGERLSDTVTQGYTFPAAPQPQVPLIHVWPDANEVGRVWRPDLGMPCDPHEALKGVLAMQAPPDAAKRGGWIDGLDRIERSLLEKTWEPSTDALNFAAVVCEIDKH